MFDNLILHDKTRRQLEQCLLQKDSCIIFTGEQHMGKAAAADEVATYFLGGEMDCHPDFMRLEPTDGVIRVDAVRELLDKALMSPVYAERKVFVVDDADSMGIAAQNAMLKLIEDGNKENLVIFISNGGLLPTIKSRCVKVEFLPCALTGEDAVLSLLADGRPGIPVLYAGTEFLHTLYDVVDCLNRSPENILTVMHAMKEKDKDFFFEKYSPDEIQEFFAFVREYYRCAVYQKLGVSIPPVDIPVDGVCCRNEVARLCDLADMADKQRMIKNYKKNDFCRFIYELALG